MIKKITRNTEVVSVSMEPEVVLMLNQITKRNGQSRSSVITEAIRKEKWRMDWERIREYGRRSARKLGITSEEDVYRIMGDA